MFVSIRTKLFIVIVLANALMVSVLLALNAATFKRSFSDYVASQESRRMQPLLLNIADEYERQGNWRWLRWDNPGWINVVQSSFSARDLRSMDRGQPGPRPGDMPMNNRNFLERLIIRDTRTGQVLLGRKKAPDQMVWLPIVSADDVVVAELGFETRTRLDAEFDQVFAEKRQRDLIYIGALGLLIAGALAIPFSGWLVRPVRKITRAVRTMTNGDLDVSVSVAGNDELGQLAADVNRLSQTLRKNHEDRQQWVSDIAHELRTPVAIFQADIEAAQDGVRKVDAAWLESMHNQVVRLTRLVNDLHQLSQSDAGTLSYRFAPIDLGALVDSAVEQFRKSCEQCHIDVHWQTPPKPIWVRGDDNRLNQLLTNLGQNTLRYTDGSDARHGHLKVTVTERAGWVDIGWSDSAPGVGEQDLFKLFDRLYRVDESRSRDSGGSGLGLAIVKSIVTAHDGTVVAKHSELGGLTVTVSLPTQKAKGI